jgi:aminoglycoside phosphotransferase (APT) family kinase protein
VLDLVAGPTMLDDLSTDPSAARGAEAGAVLGELHDRLHRVPGLRGATLLHLDLHPANVILAAEGPVVIDWTNAADGEPGLDLAITWLTLVPFVPLAPDSVTAMIDALLAGPRRAAALAHIDAAAELRLADRNLSDDEKAAIAAFVSASG